MGFLSQLCARRIALKFLTTWWERFIAILYILSFVFSLIALALTVMALSKWHFAYETVEWTRWIFSKFGLFWGAILIALRSFVAAFAPPILSIVILRKIGDEEFIGSLIRFLIWAFIEAYGFYVFTITLLDMSNNIFVVNSILHGKLMEAPLSETLIASITNPLLLIVFILSLCIRILRFYTIKRNTSA